MDEVQLQDGGEGTAFPGHARSLSFTGPRRRDVLAPVLDKECPVKRSSVLLVAATAAATFATAALASIVDRHASTISASAPFDGKRSVRGAPWSENFDSYAAGSQIIGQGGWEGWMGDPNAGALVDDDFSVSAPNSINVSGPTDIVQQFSGLTSGAYVLTAQQYIPAGFAGQTFFIVQNTYLGETNWSTQVNFDSANGSVNNTGASAGSIPYVTGEWVEIRVEIDLDANTQSFYYDDQLLYTGTWTEEVSGAGALNIASLNLFAQGASPVYYDDISLVPATGEDYAVSVTADPADQSGQPGETVTYTITIANEGGLDDTYDVTVDSVWTATPSQASVEVAAGESETIDVEVEIDAAGVPGDDDVATVTVTSTGDPTVSADVDLTTTIAELPDCIFADGFEEGGDGTCDAAGGPGTNLEEGFEDVEALFSGENPWLRINNSEPVGPQQWAQNPGLVGDPAQHAGSPDSAIVSSYQATTPSGTGTISNWLLTPEIDFSDTTTVSFWTRAFNSVDFPDRLELRACAGSPCTNVGTGSAAVGDFEILLLSVNPDLVGADDPTGANGYPGAAFAQFTADAADGLPTSGTGRIAFRYFVTDAGGTGVNSSTIAIDTVSIQSPE